MAEQYPSKEQGRESKISSTDRGLFDCFGKKEEKLKEDVAMAQVEQKPSLTEKLHRSDSSSSSSVRTHHLLTYTVAFVLSSSVLCFLISESLCANLMSVLLVFPSEEEVEEGGVKLRRRKKKGLAEKIKEQLPGHKEDDGAAAIPNEYNHHHQVAATNAEEMHPEENKGFFEKIKEKMPAPAPAPTHCGADGQCGGTHEPKEKKGIFEKIIEKLPGGHKDDNEGKKEHA